MPARNRTLDQRNVLSGTRFHRIYYNPAKTVTAQVGTYKTCSDVTGNPKGANPLDLYSLTSEATYLSGERSDSGGLLNKYQSVPIVDSSALDPNAQYGTIPSGTVNNWGLEILQRTNVSVADASLPTFIGELKDIPSLLKDWHGGLLRQVSKGTLSWRWAVKPFVGDLRKLCQFTANVDRRVKVLQKLREKRRIRKRVALRNQEFVTTPSNTTMYSDVAMTLYSQRRVHYTEEVWGSCQWKLMNGVTLPKSAEALRLHAIGLTYGITTYEALATLWALTPWSWFVDWFANVDGFIKAYNNTIPCQSSNVCVMQRTVATANYLPLTGLPPWASVSGTLQKVATRKRRYVSSPTSFPLLSLPFLDAGKWAVLGALVSMRFPDVDLYVRYRTKRTRR